MIEEKLGIICDSPYYELEEFEKIISAEKGFLREELAEIKKALMELGEKRRHLFDPVHCSLKQKEKESLAFFVLLTQFNLCPGSKASIKILKLLNEKVADLNQVFNSEILRHILKHKFTKVKKLGYFLSFVYLIYLFYVTFYPDRIGMTIWFIFYALMKGFSLHGQWNGSKAKFYN
jgi:hypothetical protein